MSDQERDDLLDTLVDVVTHVLAQIDAATQRGEDGTVFYGHLHIWTYQRAFDVLEKAGRLRYWDRGRRWARIYTTADGTL
jgi:hypothetical protein